MRSIAAIIVLLSSMLVLAQEVPPSGQETPPPSVQEPVPSPESETQDKPASRPKYNIELNKESSSFVADPDSLDPLPLKKESLKEDDEPVLEDIKSILKSGRKTEKKSDKSKVKPKAKKSSKKSPTVQNRNPDDPNLALEKRFNDVYTKFNSTPTEESIWGVASSKAANIYTVQKGDTLFTISKTLFGDSQFWPKIWALNNMGITNPHKIAIGTKIYFYPGDGGKAPSLSIGETKPVSTTADTQNTEFNRLVIEGDKNKIGFQNVPPSFPVYRGSEYYKKSQSTQIELTAKPDFQDRAPENPFILTATKIESDYKVSEKEAASLLCKENQYVSKTIKIGKGAQSGRYSMLVSENANFTRLKKTYLYRIIGEADIGSDESMRISQCISPINTDLILMKAENMTDVKPPNELIPDTRSQIIEGVDVFGQQYYYSHQYVILNMSQLPVMEGSDLKVYSDSVGGVIGEIRILKRTGTMAIGYVINNNDLIQAGDRVIIPE